LLDDLQAHIYGGPQQGRQAHASPGEDRAATAVAVFEPRGQLLVDVAGLGFDQDPAAWCQHLGTAVQETNGQAANADIAVRQQNGSPPALRGQRIEHRTVQGRSPGLAYPCYRGPRDVHPQRRNAPFGKRHSQPPGTAAHVEDRATAVPEQFLVRDIWRPAPPE
jgi:hypothetical protein